MSSRADKIYFVPFLFMAIILAILGLINLHSATQTLEILSTPQGSWQEFTFSMREKFSWFPTSTLFWSQSIYTVVGIGIMLVVARLPLRYFYYLAPYIYLLSLGLLVLVLVLGSKVHGSLSWLDLGIVRLQPSELAKLGLVIMMSRYLGDFEKNYSLTITELIKPTLIFLIPMVLVILQNDLGSSLFFGLIFASMLLVQGVDWRLVVFGILIVACLSIVAFNFVLKPYQKDRVVQFMNPEQDARGAGYHLVQSKVAVGSGQILGKGYLKGTTNKLKFLPERHTDFIFPVLAEEWGFVGCAVVLGLYGIFLFFGVHIALRSHNRFSIFLSLGVVSLFFWHMVINLGGVLGLMPLTGVPFPLFSYGGSSLMATWLAIGMLMSTFKGRGAY